MADNIRGLEEKHEHGASEVARDTRPLGIRVAEFLGNPTYALCILAGFSFLGAIKLSLIDVCFLFCLGEFAFSFTRKQVLPFRLPKVADRMDYNDVIPGTNTPMKAGGIFHLGNERNTQKELWFNNSDLRTHMLIFGSTGSGKTETLIGLVFNSLVQASGFIYIDGKGDNSLYSKIFSMVRSMGRDDDLLLINFMTGARDVIGAQKTRLSNTMNPFALGSSSMLAQLVTSLMDDSGGGGGGDMWKGRAISFVESLMKILCAMRDEGHILMDANVIRNYFSLEKLEQIVCDRRFPITETTSIPLDNIDPVVLEPITNYVNNLPGYNKSKKGNQAGEVREQHGFITMQLTRVFGSLADVYGHIVRANLAEVDIKDVVLNRRVLVVLLPALEKSPEELSNLGKIIVASIKAMMAAGLGDEVEGSYQDVILRKPTNSPAPYVCVMDEYGYYAVKGFAVVPAQARSLGFSAIFAGQDLPAFQKVSKEEAASIVANTNIKICMKLEDPTETWDLFNKMAGETYSTNVSGFQVGSGSMTNNYTDTRNASIDKRSRIDLLDLKDQREGDMHIFFRSRIVRARSFYAAPKPVKMMQVNQMIGVEKPTDELLLLFDRRVKRFHQVFHALHFVMDPSPENEDINTLRAAFSKNTNVPLVEAAAAALLGFLEVEIKRQREENAIAEAEVVNEFSGEVSLFTPVYAAPEMYSMIGESDIQRFCAPLAIKSKTLQSMVHIHRLCGVPEAKAQEFSKNLVKELEDVTLFPPTVTFPREPQSVLEDLKKLIVSIGGESYAPLVNSLTEEDQQQG
ncbi:MAG: TraM recognition domain-containing protein [Pseudomonadota bacterium]